MNVYLLRFLPSIFILCLLTLSGCQTKIAESPKNLTEAEKKFVESCRTTHQLNVHVFHVDKTVWIYLPLSDDLLDYRGIKRSLDEQSKKQFVINTFEGDFKDPAYRFMFDITDGIKTSKDQGYKSEATEPFIKSRMLLYGSINESFLDLPKEQQPEFMVVIIANIKKGIAYKTIFNLQDYILYRSEALPFEEYNLREISELYGDATLIDDQTGKNLEIKPIDWSWFLIEQISNRVDFKFTRSDFPPKEDIVIEIASIIANTFRYYDYQEFSKVLLKDIREKQTYQFDRQQLASFYETASSYEERKRSMIRMRFLSEEE